MNIPDSSLPRIVVAGSGFAGLELAKALRKKPFQIVLRRIFHGAPNIVFRMAEVQSADPEAQIVEASVTAIWWSPPAAGPTSSACPRPACFR